METSELLTRIGAINVWRRHGVRAPHKPLLLLYALGLLARGAGRMIPYKTVDAELRALLAEFGPPRQSIHPEYPFWRLCNDGLWELQGAEHVHHRQGQTDAKKSELLRYHVAGGFPDDIFRMLSGNPALVDQIAWEILERNFPSTLHEEILTAVGLPTERFAPTTVVPTKQRRGRDPAFRPKVLTAYGFRCGICGFNVRIRDALLALDAAHIQWHQADGPDIPANGIALCSLHHRLFDRGAVTVSQERIIMVSDEVNGSTGLEEWLLAYHGRELQAPIRTEHYPRAEFLDWHWKQVFRGSPR